MITLTESAAHKVKDLIDAEGTADLALRVSDGSISSWNAAAPLK